MATVTGRKHIIAAIRRATLCSQRAAMDIVDLNWNRIHFFSCDMRFAQVIIDRINPADFSGQLSVWDNKEWKTSLSVPAGGLRTIATTSLENAYAARPNPYLPRAKGIVSNVRIHKKNPSCVQLDLEGEGFSVQTFALLPLSYHTGSQLLKFAETHEFKLSNVIYQAAERTMWGDDHLPTGIDPKENVAEFIIPMSDIREIAIAA